ncbi:hypothetical protein Calkr_0235 [Caldicellulosiruptor acetigenus I77R1B]|uniref:Uncharacterized protein n=2 Tax=Caldicellulosiruptor acetigenus TaxID=301953 RepID=G2PW76_9FIRM|nr:hypothetical protein [Caldicellulosiruptor acetigenus]ADQ39800.1 hypothetical protein Calkr_0235 [Caldicellulosiruptor acetigenus I77R1B]AEM74677.1 hypothetical protein Calla_2114 [Caldicellulosiruptor acetigenus 6A]
MLKKKEKNLKTTFIGVLVEIGLALGFIAAGAIVTLIPYLIAHK